MTRRVFRLCLYTAILLAAIGQLTLHSDPLGLPGYLDLAAILGMVAIIVAEVWGPESWRRSWWR